MTAKAVAVVTGGAGFIGSSPMVDLLLARGYRKPGDEQALLDATRLANRGWTKVQ